jgi:hypothetical protein
LDRAKKAHFVGNHAQALSLAARAAEIRSTPSVRQFIAEEQYEVGQFADSMTNAELCVVEALDDKALRHRKEILDGCKELITELKKSVGRIVVSLPSPVPPGAQVMVSGHLVPETLYGRPYWVSSGYIGVEASAPGCVPFERELVVGPGEEVTVMVSLPQEFRTAQAVPPVAEPLQPPATRDAMVGSAGSENRTSGQIGPYVVLGVGAVSLGASAVFLVLRNNASHNLAAGCNGPNLTDCPDSPHARSLQSKVFTYNLLTNVATGVGGAAVVGGAIWLFYKKKRSSGTPPRAELQITPTQGGALVGIVGTL